MAAVAGGAIVGMPLLYTMEMWFHGMTLSEIHLLILLGVILIMNFGFSLVSGFRHDQSPIRQHSHAARVTQPAGDGRHGDRILCQ